MRSLLSLALAIPVAAQATPVDRRADAPAGPIYTDAVAPMDTTVTTRLTPQVEALVEQLLRDGKATKIDGIAVFGGGDKFLPGKIAATMAHRIVALDANDPRLDQRLREFADLAELTLANDNESWGLYYYINALHDLHARGLLDRAVRPETLATLKQRLDWRRFVRPDLSLINLPNNYYGVAFSIARFRHLLGWEDASAGDQLLARMIDHYRKYSGEYGFADETEGKGRFDRYSVLLIGEIAHRLLETGMTPSDEVKAWLRKSVDLLLPRFNLHGEGFEYGRSIGTYGDTAFLEVLTAAALLKVMTPVEERMAYAFSSRVTARYMDFWIDPVSGSVDMWGRTGWGQGRRTDVYRGEARILGENFSLARQHIYTNAIWNRLGYRGQAPDPGFARWLDTLPRSTMTWFARGLHDRGLVTIRDGKRMIALPIINGAEGQHMNNPYFPTPFSPGMLAGSADATFPQLLPRITLANGDVLMPLAFFKDVRVTRRGAVTEISWHQTSLDRMGGNDAQLDTRVSIETRYRFSPGKIERRDRIVPAEGVQIARVDIEFATFSGDPVKQPGGVRFTRGAVQRFSATGYGECAAQTATDSVYRSPTGPFATVVKCGRFIGETPSRAIEAGWSLSYN
ncbi:MAG: hypothetical protein ACK4GG_03115 [Sphingomonas sp.]